MKLDISLEAIHREMLRRHPEISAFRSVVYLPHAAGGAFAVISDTTNVPVDTEVQIGETLTEDYHGLTVHVVRWVEKKRGA